MVKKMLERTFTIKCVASKNCFCYLSPNIVQSLIYKEYIKIHHEGTLIFCSVGPFTESVKEDEIGINRLYCKALGLEENSSVTVSDVFDLPTISRISVSALTTSDFEVLELLAEEIQTLLLSQIRVVNSGQKFVVWIGNSISLTLYVDSVEPVASGCLGHLTEVEIKPPSTPRTVVSGTKYKEALFSFEKFKQLLYTDPNEKDKEVTLEKYLHDDSELVLRTVPFPKFLDWQNIPKDRITENSFTIFNAYVFRFSLPKHWVLENSEKIIVCFLRVLHIQDEISTWMMDTVYVKLCIIDDVLQDVYDPKECSEDNIFLHDNLIRHLNLKLGQRVILKHIDYLDTIPIKEMVIQSKKYSKVSVEEEFRKELANACEESLVVLTADIPIRIGQNIVCSVKFKPGSELCVVTSDFLRKCTFSLKEEPVCIREGDTDEKVNFLNNISNFESIIDNCIIHFLAKMKYQDHRQNLILVGRPGMGKSTLLKMIEEKLHKLPYFPFVEKISCKTLKGKSLESLKELFSTKFKRIIHQQPSVLLLDDLHVICEHVDEASIMAQKAIYFNRISEMLHNILYSHTSSHFVTVIATVETLSKLNKNLYESRGSHLFQRVYDVSDLNKKDKILLMEFLFSKYNINNLDFDLLATKTEGFAIQDFVDFSEKAAFMAIQKVEETSDSEDVDFIITKEDCDEALKNTVVLSLENINLHSPGNKDFSDIGGLSDIKKLLIENLLWPVQYPNIFDKSPLRLQSGLLLYGPPGTGKTILAGAAAKHCGLRLISVKGPELLSKYIGASEQSVREVFEKAQSAKPCLLFFDEFDSLAPRRGHDNTGVTDRVVNQLLTQLDGVEALTGVCVLAATSRPDLLDPALLRPGRLDRQIKCPLPNESDRLEILKVLSKTMKLSSDIDLEKIGKSSNGFSGADLQAVLYTAQLSALDHLLDNKETPFSLNEVTQKHLEEALKKTRPSLTKQERLRYERIYNKFEGGGLPDFDIGVKATLA